MVGESGSRMPPLSLVLLLPLHSTSSAFSATLSSTTALAGAAAASSPPLSSVRARFVGGLDDMMVGKLNCMIEIQLWMDGWIKVQATEKRNWMVRAILSADGRGAIFGTYSNIGM